MSFGEMLFRGTVFGEPQTEYDPVPHRSCSDPGGCDCIGDPAGGKGHGDGFRKDESDPVSAVPLRYGLDGEGHVRPDAGRTVSEYPDRASDGSGERRCGPCARDSGGCPREEGGRCDLLADRPGDGDPPHSPRHADLHRLRAGIRRSGGRSVAEPLAVACQGDPGRSASAQSSALHPGGGEAGSRQDPDHGRAYGASYPAPVPYGDDPSVPSCDPA